MRLRNEQTGSVIRVNDQLGTRLLRRGWIRIDQPPADTQPAGGDDPDGGDLPADKDELLAIAEREGITVDRRWGVARLTETIRTVRARHG